MTEIASAEAMLEFGRAIAARLRAGDIIACFGDLGAGKTTLARGILTGLGHQGEVPSPTFTLVQSYASPPLRLPFLHCDLYRISHAEEAYELGLEEGLETGALFVEWPERLGDALWPEALRLSIRGAGTGQRAIAVSSPAEWKERWPV